MSRAEIYAALHARAFPIEGAWTAADFADLLSLSTTEVEEISSAGALVSILVAQVVAGEAEILTLATDPEERRQGFAQRLLSQMEQRLRPSGLSKWLLDVAADNSGARAFYEALGFQIDGQRKDYYERLEGSRVDAILMSKPVGGQTP